MARTTPTDAPSAPSAEEDRSARETAIDAAVAATLDPSRLPPAHQPDMKKRDLVEEVVARSGVRKRDAKPAVEALLAILGETLASGRDLNLPPLGKVKLTNARDTTNAEVLTARIRRPSATQKAASGNDATDDHDPLASGND
ncbi:DNA-binding protein HU-alpha [Roseivivax marinus]|uniref:HU family DNA-binding protein n=1 Tax=Roseivivax marinus TaxID=1379903 RepID=UPI0008D04C57|nr:HU family DNA-binding protein [Roseivivax marinus]SEL73940.1 DNA-binding protein HU-alpha [Roseivivax marinus]